MTKAVVDCGTNSVRLLALDDTGSELARDLTITRLGEGVDASRTLRSDAMRRTVDTIAGFVSKARRLGADDVLVAATSAVRDAANRDEFLSMVREQAGVEPVVLSGQQEARCSFAGASVSFPPDAFKVVVDIGGGSTELVAGRDSVASAVSLDVGSVRLTERHVRTDPPSPGDQDAVRAAARAIIEAGASRPSEERPVLVGVAGTATTIAALSLGLPAYDRAAVHRSVVTAERLGEIRAMLATMTVAERGAIAVVTPGRADVIVSGAILLEEVLSFFGASEVTVSETDILDGLAATLR